ncbi:MAG TPA: DUF72 domain-containing protein [Vicinamibacterales bacterium]|nr:DUF72 domain-containing protein [Vicinamibacterales bacterium]
MSSHRIRVGCSGWQYPSWRGRFYPADLPASRWLPFYAARFDTVEINNTFYRLPEAATFADWRRRMPAGFVAAIKASRYLTHLKRLIDPEEPIRRLLARARALGPRLGPVLYQLPARFVWSDENANRLCRLLQTLPKRGRRHAIEFRDPSWYRDDVFRAIDRAGAAVCWHDMAGSAIDESPGQFVYVRFHGATGKYRGDYSRAALLAWARRLRAAARTRDAYVYFNNDVDAAAVRNAVTLRELCR